MVLVATHLTQHRSRCNPGPPPLHTPPLVQQKTNCTLAEFHRTRCDQSRRSLESQITMHADGITSYLKGCFLKVALAYCSRVKLKSYAYCYRVKFRSYATQSLACLYSACMSINQRVSRESKMVAPRPPKASLPLKLRGMSSS